MYSEQGKSRNGGSSTGRSVVVSHSNFNFAQDGSGASAFHANGGKVAIETSRFDTQEVSPFQREEKSGSSVGLEGLEVAPALAVMDGNLIVTNTVFLGFGLEEGWGSGAIAFEESDGEEGQHRFLVSMDPIHSDGRHRSSITPATEAQAVIFSARRCSLPTPLLSIITLTKKVESSFFHRFSDVGVLNFMDVPIPFIGNYPCHHCRHVARQPRKFLSQRV